MSGRTVTAGARVAARAPRARARRARRGVVLALVLWVLVVLGGIALGVTAATRQGSDATTNLRARVTARYAAESGVVRAVARLERALLEIGSDSVRRRALLNDPSRLVPDDVLPIGEGRVQVAIVDASARVDVNAASESQLAALFARTGPAGEARSAARAIKAHIAGDGVNARLLRSLDELRGIDGVSEALASRAAPFLTVDGDGRVNRATAPREVLAAAAGELQDEPSRLVIVARGWRDGHPLTHELQVAWAVQGTQLALVTIRERDL
ncbi:MAG: general secretion pathway protein GspK [Gemmatimonadaceae bacterium]|nr:general secretion pathway protein GspK [Gemmatimonadaceae bacterium]